MGLRTRIDDLPRDGACTRCSATEPSLTATPLATSSNNHRQVRMLGARLGYHFSAPPPARPLGHPSASSWPTAGIGALAEALDRGGLYEVHRKGEPSPQPEP